MQDKASKYFENAWVWAKEKCILSRLRSTNVFLQKRFHVPNASKIPKARYRENITGIRPKFLLSLVWETYMMMTFIKKEKIAAVSMIFAGQLLVDSSPGRGFVAGVCKHFLLFKIV